MRVLRLSQQQRLGCLAVASPTPASRPSPSPRPCSGLSDAKWCSEAELDLPDHKFVDMLERQGDLVQLEDLERPQSRGLSLGLEAKQRYYGPNTGGQVEEELRRLGALVQSLLKDFALVKDSVWHLQDERDLVQRRVDLLESGSVAALHEQSADTTARLEALARRAELTDVRVKGAEDEQEKLNTMLGRVELLDSRLAALEITGFAAHASAARRPRSGASQPGRALSPLTGVGAETAAAGVAASGMRASFTKETLQRPQSVASEVYTEDSGSTYHRARSGFESEGTGMPDVKEEEALQSFALRVDDAAYAARMDAVHDMYLSVEQDAARELARVLVEETDPRTQSSSCTGSRPVSPLDGPLVAEGGPPAAGERHLPTALDASFGRLQQPELVAPRVSPGHRLRADGGTSRDSGASSCDGQRRRPSQSLLGEEDL